MEHSVSGTAVLDKAVSILDALTAGPMGVSELARATGISRPTAHRLCSALEQHRLIVRDSDDRRSLGSKAQEWCSSATTMAERLVAASELALRDLRNGTGESVQLYVREGDRRRCIAGLESTQGLRTIVEVGAFLPLTAGSAATVLNEAAVSKRGWAQSIEEREKGVASVSAPVYSEGQLVAAISVSGPIDRLTRSPGRKYGEQVRKAARQVELALT